jgi:uncharacterized protein (TIGR01244 family)
MRSAALLAVAVSVGACWAQTAPVIEPTTLGAAPNATQIKGKVIFAGQPDEAGLKEAAGRDVKTVINLRTDTEMAQVQFDEAKLAAESGMSYVTVPVQQTAPSEADQEKIFSLLDEAQKPGGRPVLLHCGTSNRVGFIWGLYQVSRNKLSAEEAVARAKAAGMKSPVLEKALRERAER